MAIQTRQAVFNGTQDHVDITWPLTFSGTYYVASGCVITDGGGAVAIALTTISATGLTVKTSAAFTGHVDLIGYEIIT